MLHLKDIIFCSNWAIFKFPCLRCTDASVVVRDQPMTPSWTRGIFYQFPEYVRQPDLCPEIDRTVTLDTYIMYLPASGSCY